MKELRKMYETDEWVYQVENRGKSLINSVKIHGSLHVAQGMFKAEGGLIKAICEFSGSKIKDILNSNKLNNKSIKEEEYILRRVEDS